MGELVPRLKVLAQEMGWDTFERFNLQFAHFARVAAEQTGDRRLESVLVSRRSYTRWMTVGLKGTPTIRPGIVLSYMFRMSVDRLFEVVDPDSLGGPLPAPVPAGALASPPVLDLDDPLAVLDRARRLTTSNADTSLVDMARTAILSIVERYEALGPHQLAGEAKLLRTMLHTLLDGQQPPSRRAELFRLTSQVAGLLGYMAVNAARPDAAHAYCEEALLLAKDIHDVELQMWARGTQSLGLYYQGRYRDADEAAAAGVALAPDHPQAIRLLANGRARALARMDRRAETERAIGQALALTEAQHVPDGLTACISFEPYSRARTVANVVTAYLSLGAAPQVLRYAEEIDPLIEESDSGWSRALVGLDVATALLRQQSPEVEHAMHMGRTALRSGTAPPITSVLQRGVELYREAGRWRSEPAVGDYAEELRAWRARPAALPLASAGSPPDES
ncbi:hypothetical protein [Streptacidiphilus jiangxiensis]|uniref:Tetratricopeptide repeat-containing protein n=1 Tax=Streptacidiphilus jiangxiensis TaxID=235985 RepID=A0A1H8B3L2_STRJI|nr:hypothetical protein [Streptacidiphilus jiangxiensis]SEM76694.1 hypothetical protein SAMN05414137_15512 [Streptacidiphilus jiangxiensis]